ncbi:MAG: DNA translocase FtsK [Terriglobales bacterium]
MNPFSRAYTPSSNRRLNELVGFLLFVAAILLLLALVSYSPADRSLNTAGPAPASRPAHNWAGILGAYGSDLMLQAAGIAAFLLPLMLAFLGGRWFRSRTVGSPGAKCAGALMLLIFAPGMLGLLPGHLHWRGAIPIEGLLGRIVGDALIHWFNLAGAYIVCAAVLAIGLYLSTTFSFATLETWAQTRFTFVFAGLERFKDWRIARAKARSLKELEKRRARRVIVSAQETKAAPAAPAMPSKTLPGSVLTAKTGIERMAEEHTAPTPEPVAGEPAFGTRADSTTRPKTTMPKIRGTYKLPSSALLHRSDEQQGIDENELKRLAQVLAEKCAEFEAHGQVTQINPGPVVTTYEFKPEAGIKYSRITSLADDLCLGLRAESILIERMAGKSTVGIQVPNRERETIWLREIIESQDFIGSKSKLTLSMGKDINGRTVTADLASMPHLLIAGSTGSGKSVAINAMIMSVLYKATPDEARLILVDPKRLELGVYEGVPHLFTPIITEPKLAANALRNAVREMERRLKALAEKGVRNIDQYNRLFDDDEPGLFDEQSAEPRRLPYIIIVIDELADLMMLDQGNVEESITRLAQMARAVGIHLILATQRPSVDVITGLIKANFPARISFRVATKVDSRTILDANGAESLLGRGDMLYLPSGSARVHRLHAPFVTEKEIAAVVEFWRGQAIAQYEEKFLQAPREEKNDAGESGEDGGEGEHDELYEDAVRLVIEFGKASTSLLQRRLRIGYGRAAHLIDLMQKDGIVGNPDGPKPREVLKKPEWLSEVEDTLR